MSCWLVLGRFVVGVPLVNVPWSLCPAGWCAWWWLPAYLGARALVVGVFGRFVGGYLYALELVPWWLVLGSGYLHALVVGRFVVGGYLHALNLVSLVRSLVVRVLVGSGYLHALVVCPWLVLLPACLEPRVPGSCLGGWCAW